MSLAWEANDLYGGGRQAAQIKDPRLQAAYMDLLYGDPATRMTLGFNIARYNIAGGDDPVHTHMRPDARMEGYQSGPGAAFDWTRGPESLIPELVLHRQSNVYTMMSLYTMIDRANCMRTNIEIDDELLSQAMTATGLATKRATVEEGLRLLVRLRKQTKALTELKGSGWEGDLGEMRQGRPSRRS